MRSGPWHEEDSRVSVRQGVSLMRKCTGGGGAETLQLANPWAASQDPSSPALGVRTGRWGSKGCARWMGPGEGQGNQSVTEELGMGQREQAEEGIPA